MISSGIYEIFSQITVGSFFVFMLSIVLWKAYQPTKGYFDWIKEKLSLINADNDSEHYVSVKVTIFFLTSFGMGLFIHSVVDDIVDVHPSFGDYEPGINDLIGSESGYRISALFEIETENTFERIVSYIPIGDKECELGMRYKLTSLGREILNNKEVILHHVDFGNDLHKRFLSEIDEFLGKPLVQYEEKNDETSECNTIKHFSRKLFYDAQFYTEKNDAFKAEIARWKTEKDFVGGLFIVALLSLLPLVILHLMYRKKNIKILNMKTILIFLSLLLLTKYGYTVSLKNLTEKTYGLYASAINLDQVKFKYASPDKYYNKKICATNWLHNSEEYEILTKQVFRHALKNISNELKGCKRSKKGASCAIIMDLDETVIRNSAYEEMLRAAKLKHHDDLMDRWWQGVLRSANEEKIKEANNKKFDEIFFVPGAKEFIQAVNSTVEVIYITARKDSRKVITEELLTLGGVLNDFSHVIYTGKKDKAKARKDVEKLYSNNVLAYFGDKLPDFSGIVKASDCSIESNNTNKCINWYMLPNPAY